MSMATMVMISGRRQRDDRGRYMEGDRMMKDRGRYMEGNQMERYGRQNEGGTGRYWPEPHMPPYLGENQMEARRMEGRRMENRNMTDERYPMRDKNVVNIRDYQDKRRIGFASNRDNREWEDEGENPYGDEPEVYRRQNEERRNEMRGNMMNHQQGSREQKMNGQKNRMDQQKRQRMYNMQEDQEDMQELDKQTAMEWVECMEDKNGVKGGAYTWHQAQQYGRNMGITGEQRLIEFYAAMNAMHSDFCGVAKKFGVDKPEFYAAMAKAFIEDPDAVDNKVYKYYECIAAK